LGLGILEAIIHRISMQMYTRGWNWWFNALLRFRVLNIYWTDMGTLFIFVSGDTEKKGERTAKRIHTNR